jgi:hypothetical protein
MIIAFLALSSICATLHGQTSGCTAQPQTLSPFSFPPGTTVYYKLDPSLNVIPTSPSGGTSPTNQIVAALDAWSKANVPVSGVGDGIKFVPEDPQHPATLNIAADSSTKSSAATTTQADDSSGILGPSNPATITFHPFGLLSGTTARGLDETASGYDTVYLEVALHELGHVQGVGDYLPVSTAPPPGPNASVMRPIIGVNNAGNPFPKTGPTDCDRATATTDAIAAGISSGSGSGGSDSPPVPQRPSSRDDGDRSGGYDYPSDPGSGKGTIIDWSPVD